MGKNYLKLALRNFKRRKGHTFINITGLAIAVACCILIGLYLQYELSFDTFHEKSDRIYRVTQTVISPDKTAADATVPPPVGPTLKSEYPRLVDKTVRLYNFFDEQFTFFSMTDTTIASITDPILETDFFYADSTFFEVFGYNLIRGNPKTVLEKPLSLVLTQEKARKFFGDEDPMGKVIHLEARRMAMTVTGIMEPMPANSHIKADVLASFNSLDVLYTTPENFYNNWFANNTWTYVLLKEGINPDELSRQFPAFIEKYAADEQGPNETLEMGLQPVENIHLYSDYSKQMRPNSSVFYVYLFATAALLLLIIACINFMNLATARASERSREVGMRKALGAGRGQLFLQFMGESFLLTFMAFVVAVVLVVLAMPVFNNLIGATLVFNPFQNISLLLGILGLFVIVGLIAGAYPALYLSGFEPREIMQKSTGNGSGGSILRKGLVVVQFTMSVILIIGTVIVFLQLRHMQQKELGFDKEQIVIMPIAQGETAWEYPTFKERVEQSSAIRSLTGMGKILGSKSEDFWKIAPAAKGGEQGETNHTLWVTHDFVDTFGLGVIAGRAFSKEFSSDAEKGLLINRKMAEKLGHDNPQDALGELFYYTTWQDEKIPYQVVGVVENFNYTSVKQEIKPMVMCLADSEGYRLGTIYYAAAKIAPGRTKEGLAHLGKIWSQVNVLDPFNYTFQDEELKKIYAQEARTSSMMGIFTMLCIVVACLGLFGLASFTASKRTKEIGIRKTLGASIGNIVIMLNKQYIKLVLIANIIAWPIIYYVASWWLQDFSSRVELGWNVLLLFVAVGITSLVICLATVSYQSFKAAMINPVESIKQE
jgi:putative ABC transport system permease protein